MDISDFLNISFEEKSSTFSEKIKEIEQLSEIPTIGKMETSLPSEKETKFI